MRHLCVGILLLALTGCQTLTVKRETSPSGKENVHGIPFYVTKGCCKQTTEWLQKTFEVTIKLKEIDIKLDKSEYLWSDSKTISEATYLSTFVDLRNAVTNFNNGTTAVFPGTPVPDLSIKTKWDAVTALSPQSTPDSTTIKSFELVANNVKLETYVDYSTQYYVNTWKPLMGTATVNAELNEKGTLSKSSATVEDKTAETLLTSVLPVKEFLTKKFIEADTTTTEVDQHLQGIMQDSVGLLQPDILSFYNIRRIYEIEVKEKDIKHTLSETRPVDPGGKCSIKKPLNDPEKYGYNRSEIKKDEKKNDKNDKKKISISGEIVLPEAGKKDDKK